MYIHRAGLPDVNPKRFRAWVKRMEKVSIFDILSGKYKPPKKYTEVKNINHG